MIGIEEGLDLAYMLGKSAGIKQGREEAIEKYNKSLKEHWTEE